MKLMIKKSFLYFVFVIASLFLLTFACEEDEENTPGDIPGTTSYYEEGLASWYGPGFQGNATASGEIFDMNKLTAAHKTLDFGTYVEVTNKKNEETVVVKINDRGPFVEGRIIDLAKAAADSINMIEDGVVEVGIRIVEP